MNTDNSTDRFWQRFDCIAEEAKTSTVGTVIMPQGYIVSHTGGGCLAWEKTLSDDFYIWITDLDNGLGETLTDEFLVGLYNADGDFVSCDGMSLDNALATARNWEAYPKEHMRLFGYR